MKILLVDDSKLIRNNLSKLLHRLEGEIRLLEAHSMHSAVQQLHIDQPDIVILDLQLPDGTGFLILEHLRLQEETPLVFVLTNFPSPGNQKRCFELGAAGFFDKSRDFMDLIAAIQQEVEINTETRRKK